MPRPLIGPQAASEAVAPVRLKATNPATLHARLGERRHAAYTEALSSLDATTTLDAAAGLQATVDAVNAEFDDVPIDAALHAIVAACTAGEGLEVHILDMKGPSAVHYRKNEPLPGGLERVRRIAMHPDYAYVEVYDGAVRAVRRDGNVTVVPNA